MGQKNLAAEFAIDTKAATGVVPGAGKNILQFAKESQEALKTKRVSCSKPNGTFISFGADYRTTGTDVLHSRPRRRYSSGGADGSDSDTPPAEVL